MTTRRRVRARHEWSEDCRVLSHAPCAHVGSARTVGLLGRRSFVTICGCPCHWGCPAEDAALRAMADACTCPLTGAQRQHTYDAAPKPSPLRRLLGHLG